jgi:iron complex outermembrane receptor protein
VRDVALREALDRLSALSGVQVAYSAEFVPVDKRVCLAADREPVGEVLSSLLEGASVQILVVAGRVVISPVAADVAKARAGAAQGMSVLERVVVTGNAVAAPRRPLVIGVEVIDGERIRREQLGSMAELLDAAVPGVWSWTQSPSTLVAQYGAIRGASSFNTTYPKIYLDGVEVANPLVVTQLNPDVIDRVEVIRGPQGSALYGSDAISGVINVLTRHDAGTSAAPLFQIRSSEGAMASSFAGGLVPTHEQRLNVRAGTNVRSAGLSVVYGQTGALFPSSESREVAANADSRLVTSNATYTASARLFDKQVGAGQNPLLASFIPSQTSAGKDSGTSAAAQFTPTTSSPQHMSEYTVSTAAKFAEQGRWTHSVVAGIDGYRLDNVADAVGPFSSMLDSALKAARGNGDRITLRENSVAHFGADGDSQTTLTLGVEQSILRQTSTYTLYTPATPGQRFQTAVDGLAETWNHNTGLLSQLSTSWHDALFVTGGVRVERNDSFTGQDRYPVLPMIGVAAVRDIGGAELKLRGAYGKGIRPPQTPARSAASGYAGNSYGPIPGVASPPALDPEVQSGFEVGAELYLGRAFSMQLTRFDQRATGLIQNVAISIDTFSHGGTNERRVRYQLQNVGEITNRGWELQSNFTRGAFSLSGAFSSVDSRVRALAVGYLGDLRAGDRMLVVPAHTGSLTSTFLSGGWSLAVGATRAMDWVNYDRIALAASFAASDGEQNHMLTGSRLRAFWRAYDGDVHLRLSASRDLSRGLSLLVTGENLLGGQLGEPDNATIRPGRAITGGLRASF